MNFGRSPVHICEMRIEFRIVDKGSMPEPIVYDFGKGRELPVGIIAARDLPYEEGENLFAVLDARIYEENAINKYKIFFLGYFGFLSVFGDYTINGFCFVFDPFSNQFVRIGDGRYNYVNGIEE